MEETANPMTTPAKRSVKFSAEEGRPDLASPQQRRVMEDMLERLVGSVIRIFVHLIYIHTYIHTYFLLQIYLILNPVPCDI